MKSSVSLSFDTLTYNVEHVHVFVVIVVSNILSKLVLLLSEKGQYIRVKLYFSCECINAFLLKLCNLQITKNK